VPARFQFDHFVLDLDAFRLERNGMPVALEPKAFSLLALMVRRPNHLFTKPEIFGAVWPDTAVTDHALTRIVAQIRRAIGDEAHEARYLETVPTRGYRWIHPVEEIAFESPTPDVVSPVVTPRRRLSSFLAVSVGVMAALLAVLVWQRTGASGPSTALRAGREPMANEHRVEWPVQITTHSGLDFHPALSPQADAIAFVSDRSGSLEIYVRALDGTATETPLTDDGGENVQPAWSPDGKFLAYHAYKRGGIWILPSRGGTPKQIVAEGSKPAWSRDGKRIAYQSDEHADAAPRGYAAQSGSTIWTVDADGANPTELTHLGSPAGGHAAPVWSPDGRYMCFSVFDAGRNNGLWLIKRETGATTLLYHGDDLFESVFSPDGSTIYVAGGDALITRLRFDPATGTVSGPREIIPVPGVPGVRGLSISPDGSRVAFAGLGLNSQIWSQRIARDGAPAGPAKALTDDRSRRNSLPVISPDGARLAYMSSRQGERANVWIMDVDGSNPVQLTSGDAFESQPEWFPDSRRVAYQSKSPEDDGLRAIDVTTRLDEKLVDLGVLQHRSSSKTAAVQLCELRLSRSMAKIAFSVQVPPADRRVLYVTARSAIQPRLLTDAALSVGYPAWSPDEQFIAVEIKEGSSTQAAIVDAESGTLRRLTNERGQTWVRSWSPDGRKIAAAVLREGRWSLQALDVAGGRERAITLPGPPRVYVRYPDWSPRGDLVVFERGEMIGNVWTIKVQ
jgi:Tol biopolymer transport system component/DNA-binding winged helix-turn-helix (wHTH) protein